MISLKIKMKDIRIGLFCLALCLGLFRICLFSNMIFRAYSFIILIVIFLIVGFNVHRLVRNRWALLLGIVIAVSVVRENWNYTSVFNACTYFLEFSTPFMLCDYLSKRYGFKDTIKGFMFASILICSIMDFSVLTGIDVDPTHYQNLITYLFGNKFMVAYLHMQTFGLVAEYFVLSDVFEKPGKRLGLLLYGIYGIILCYYVDCATGILGNMVIILLIFLPISEKIKDTLSRPLSMMLILLVANILLIGTDVLMKTPVVQYVITNLLHKDLTLTGRFAIYGMLPKLFLKQLYWGYGYNSDIFANLIGYGNAQNGILQYVLDCGLVGAIIFILNWIHSISMIKYNKEKSWPLICVVYGFIICSLVEVCFKFSFILILALIINVPYIKKEFH